MYKNKKIIAIIPARGGSKGIPRKNVRSLAGNPLISYVINTVKSSDLIDDFVVTTDDSEIEDIALKHGADVVLREEELSGDDITLDPVIYDALKKYEKKNNVEHNYVITIQPTSPLLKVETLNKAINKIIDEDKDNLISVVNDPHLSWGYDNKTNGYYPLYEKRVNRQHLPESFKETGAIFIAKSEHVTPNSRLGKSISLIEVDKQESIDVDSYLDWWVAEKLISKKKILIKTDGEELIGTGHIYRTLNIASKLTDHDVLFLLNKNKKLGIEIIESNNYPYITHVDDELDLFDKIAEYNPDIVINDILNTTEEYIKKLKEDSYFVVNFEDLGSGSEFADVVFDELYEHKIPRKNLYYGYKYYILRDEFTYYSSKKINKEVKNILLTFGGTDPSDLTRKTLNALNESSYDGNITVILGLGCKDKNGIRKEYESSNNVKIHENVKNISKYMFESDLIFTSAGRTMYEVASLGVPSICMCQNERELTHLFGSAENGFVNLGLGIEVSDEKLVLTIEDILKNHELRLEMNKRMKSVDLRHGFDNVINIINSKYDNFKDSYLEK